jgi:hypothetical protein
VNWISTALAWSLPVTVLYAIPTQAAGSPERWNDAYAPFDATKNTHNKMEVVWMVVRDPVRTCNEEGRKRFKDFKGLSYVPEACAIWEGRTCTIITSKKPTMHALGHELRHCFQGHWHDPDLKGLK